MIEHDHLCPKCGATMSAGFLTTWREGNVNASRWLAREPDAGRAPEPKASSNPPWTVATYRCSSCGFLESYATEPV